MINIIISKATDVNIVVLQGASRTNMTIIPGDSLGRYYTAGSRIQVPVSNGAMVFVRPRENRFSPVNFELTYGVIGDKYYEVEKLIIGPHGFTYFIVGCSVAGFMGLLLIISIICCIVKCCRSQS